MITLFINKILEGLKKSNSHKELIKQYTERKFPLYISNLRGPVFPAIISDLKKYSKGSFLLVFPSEKDAEIFCRDAQVWDLDALFFPGWETLPYSRDIPSSSASGSRIKALGGIISSRKPVAAASLRSLLTWLPDRDFLMNYFITLEVNKGIDVRMLTQKMQEAGYLRVPRVSVHGEFAVRGEVFDLFMHGMDDAVRIVFEFDIVEKIKYFDPFTQASTGSTDLITIIPCREIIWTDRLIESAAQKNLIDKNEKEELKEMKTLKGEEYIFPLAFDKPSLLSDYTGADTTIVLVDSELLETGYSSLLKEYTLLYEKDSLLMPEKILPDFNLITAQHRKKIILPVMGKQAGLKLINYDYEPGRSFFGNFNYLKDEITRLKKEGFEITIFTSSESQGARIENILKDFDVQVTASLISRGFSLPKLKIAAIHESEIFGRKKRIPVSVTKARSRAIDSFVELNEGDFVVHVNYGIGMYLGIDRIKAANTERDYIKLEYADEERLFIPIEQVNLVQRYIGSDGSAPRLDRLGGKSWENRKSRVKQAAEDIAEKLIVIYSKRKQAKGYAFPADTDWQTEFEAMFPYDETDDQLQSIFEIKQDMEKPRPMDRLLCGDVGYGKTEVAMRAAFKAAAGGRQVAYLAPTTILAEQHYESFLERFSNYPVEIAMLSRFVGRGEQKKVLQKAAAGDIDIIIGTHRILQKDVVFKNLGLMIIDEEQRFGVKDKERMKDLKSSIDCLTLSATPIPRTLHMSLLKIRDMSVLKTPPHNRRPIETFVQEFTEETIISAVRREIERGGQVFYLHNRIESLDNIKMFLQKLMPEILVETAHGRMNPSEIEDTMKRFIHHGIHVLVSTTIIENGIDIPNVNTIIIDRADMYGISQLYQLRGRVGRSDRLAYAFLLYPEKRALSEIAMKRLQIISDNTELGSGFRIALKDLEVRGAGNLLGKQQSGEIASVGFDMYLRLIDEAVRELEKDKDHDEAPEVYLELEYSGYIPDTYINDQLEKMEVYKSITSISNDVDLDRVYAEIEDRYGPLPDEVDSLMSLAEIRIICRKLYISSMKERKGVLEIEFSKVSLISADRVLKLIREGQGKVTLDSLKPNILIMKTEIIGLKEKSAFIREKLTGLL